MRRSVAVGSRRLFPLSVSVVLGLGAITPSAALPPGETRFRDGANHRVGDDSFVARAHRAPGAADTEVDRMRIHLEYVRDRLAAAPATRPELAARRAELLGYLGDYIAKGTTPQNTRLPWRSPVFIDDFGNICAVGYLIERSAGRALPERIAELHRFDFLEDIAAAMLEVRAWVDASGFTLDELASIQPGYAAPMVEQWNRWHLGGRVRPPNGTYASELGSYGITTHGAFKRHQMHGTWTRQTDDGRVIGSGTLKGGAGWWRSFYRDGKKLAEGPFAQSLPHGAWTFYHPSGRVAAEGRFVRGERDGAWRFYYDKKQSVVIASGSFKLGSIGGTWEHFDERGHRIAVSKDATPAQWKFSAGGHLLEVAPYANGVVHAMHSGNIAGDDWRLDGFFRGSERLYVRDEYRGGTVYDGDGRELKKDGPGGAWTTRDCGWSAKRKAVARAGDITTLHGLFFRDRRSEDRPGGDCTGEPTPVPRERAARIDQMLTTLTAVRTPIPTFVKDAVIRDSFDGPALGKAEVEARLKEMEEAAKEEAEAARRLPGAGAAAPSPEEVERDARFAAQQADLTKTLAASMGWYIEFPHIDGKFVQVFYTLPGFQPWGPPIEFSDEPEE